MTIKPVVPSFPNPEEGKAALRAKDAFEPVSLYPRDGTEELFRLEEKLAELVRMQAGEVLAFGSGMQAVREAVELANLTSGDKAVFAKGLYSQSMNYQDMLKSRGVNVINPDIENTGLFVDAIQENKPQLIYAETVTNTPRTQVLNVERLLDMPLAEGWDPLIILDPTLATPSQRPLADLINKTDKRVVLVESGTKNYRLNTGLLGMVHTKRKDLMQILQKRRRTVGATPDVSVVRATLRTLPDKEKFDARNQRILSNNKLLSKMLYEMLKPNTPFLVSHPNLPNHPNYDYASKHYPNGATQCSFITDRRPEQENGGYELLEALWGADPEGIELGQSFGMDKTRLWYDAYNPAIRFSCGTEDPNTLVPLAKRWAAKLNQF